MKRQVIIMSAIVLCVSVLVYAGIFIGNKLFIKSDNKNKIKNVENKNDEIAFTVSSVDEKTDETKIVEEETVEDKEKSKEENEDKETVNENTDNNRDNSKEIIIIGNSYTSTSKNTDSDGSNFPKIVVNEEENKFYNRMMDLIRENDSRYVGSLQSKYNTKCNFDAYNVDADTINTVKKYWGVDVAGYYKVSGTDGAGKIESSMVDYFINMDTGRFYICPNQGNMDMYEISKNEVVNTHPYIAGGESMKWR